MRDIKQALTERWHQELATSMDRPQFEDWLTTEADRLETPPHLQGMARIRRGVEFDREGAPVAVPMNAAR